MEKNSIYITQLPGDTKENDLLQFLESKLSTKCRVSVRHGKIPNTNIAFGSIGDHDVESAISKLNNAEFRGIRIKVQRYRTTEKNRRFNESSASLKEKVDPRTSVVSNPMSPLNPTSVTNVVNGKSGHLKFVGVMVHLVSAEEFYLQVTTDCTSLSIVNSHMTLLDHKTRGETVENAIVGEVYATKYSADNKFYRALVLSKEEDNKIQVQFVDYGNVEIVNADSLVVLPLDIANLDFAAKCCRIYAVTVIDEEKAAEIIRSAGDKFQVERFSENQHIHRFKLWEVDLLDDGGRSLREHLVGSGCMKAEENLVAGNLQDDSTSHTASHQSSFSETASPPMDDALTDALSPNSTCIITHVDSADSFYIQGAFDKQFLNKIYQCLMNADQLEPVPISHVLPNKLYCAKFSLDLKWYRCSVILRNNRAPEVYFVDFGNSEELHGELHQLPAEIAAIKPQALRCHLSGVQILSQDRVKAELTNLANSEISVKCIIHKELEGRSAAIDFSAESKYRSFCSYLIEQRLAERMYKNNTSVFKPPPTSLIPPQVMKRNRVMDVSKKPVKKRESYPHPGTKNNILPPGNRAANSKIHVGGDTFKHPVIPDVQFHTRETIMLSLTTEIEDGFHLRRNLNQWRCIIGILPSGSRQESLMDYLEQLLKIKDENYDEIVSENTTESVHRNLILLKKKVMDIHSEFEESIRKLNDALSANDEESTILEKADSRDNLAEALMENADKFINALSSTSELVDERIKELEEKISHIDFLLDKCPLPSGSEYSQCVERGKDIWAAFLTSEKLDEVVETTDAASRSMENTRQSLGFITGIPVDEGKQGSQQVKCFFPNLEGLTSAMRAELSTYSSHLVSGENGKVISSCLSVYKSFVKDLLDELLQRSEHEHTMCIFKKEADRLLAARSALNGKTVESMETTSQKMKKARSQLRHLLADLEDVVESESEDSKEIEKLRESIDEIRLELHTILKDAMEQKESIAYALELRPELSLQLLKIAGPTMACKDVVTSWETSYFEMKPLNSDQTFYGSKFGEEDVFIKKILITDGGLDIRKQIKDYQTVTSTSDGPLLPILAAFVPPKETHVLYYIVPTFVACDAPKDFETLLNIAHSYLNGFHKLASTGISCSAERPLANLVKVEAKNLVLLKPSIFLETNPQKLDIKKAVQLLESLIPDIDYAEAAAFKEILMRIRNVDDIPAALSGMEDLLSNLLCSQCEELVSVTDEHEQNSESPENTPDENSKEETSDTVDEGCQDDAPHANDDNSEGKSDPAVAPE